MTRSSSGNTTSTAGGKDPRRKRRWYQFWRRPETQSYRDTIPVHNDSMIHPGWDRADWDQSPISEERGASTN